MAGVIIGSVNLTGIECPERPNFGGTQEVVTHNLIGGGRTVDAMGAIPADIIWQGRLQGTNALARALALDEIRKSGQQVTLAWGVLSFQVLVAEFLPNYEKKWQIPYSIRCVVVSENAASVDLSTLDQSYEYEMAWLTSLMAQLAAQNAPSVAPQISGLNSAVSNVSAAANSVLAGMGAGSSGLLQQASIPQLAPLLAAAQAAVSAFEQAIGTIPQGGVVLDGSNGLTGAAAVDFLTGSIATEQANTAALAVLQIAAGHASVLALNIGNATG